MITVEQAEKLLAEHPVFLPTETVPIENTVFRVLREPIAADRDIPPYNRVMMDGFALASRAVQNGIRRFHVETTLAAGAPPLSLKDPMNGCVRVMTGAILPNGCDAVIPKEDVTVTDDQTIEIRQTAVEPYQYVHRQGMDRAASSMILRPGQLLQSPQIAILAATGVARVSVSKQPAITVVASGDELIELGQPVQPWQIRPSNTYAILASLAAAQLRNVRSFHVRDSKKEIESVLAAALDGSDILIISGGVSAGEYDLMPSVLTRLGVRCLFHKVKQRPGKPLWFGLAARCAVFGLPGNPVATTVCVRRYVLPYLFRCMGCVLPPPLRAVLAAGVHTPAGLVFFQPVHRMPYGDVIAVEPLPMNNSGDYAALAESDGFAELPATQTHWPVGSPVSYFPWSLS